MALREPTANREREYAAMLAESGISAESEQTCEDGLVLTTPVDVERYRTSPQGG